MKLVQVLLANGDIKRYSGPTYRGLLQDTLRNLIRTQKPLPFSLVDSKRLPLTDLVRMDNEWSEANQGGTFATLVDG